MVLEQCWFYLKLLLLVLLAGLIEAVRGVARYQYPRRVLLIVGFVAGFLAHNRLDYWAWQALTAVQAPEVRTGDLYLHFMPAMHGCGSGSGLDPESVTLWIRIRIGNPDPDPGARK
jgi:hypothetical protein